VGTWKAYALPRVSRGAIETALAAENATWESVAHVTATTTLAAGIRDTGVVGLPVATVLDLVTMPGLPGDMALPLDGFPGPDELTKPIAKYQSSVRRWQDQASARRIGVGIRVDDSLRAFVRERAEDPAARALLASRREYARTVHALVASGVRPTGLKPRDHVGRLAAQAWARAESEVEALGAPRELLWVDFDDLERLGTQDASALADRVRSALAKAFGGNERWTVVHHGFYFYTPPQWALFQVMRRIPEVDQVFIVHDDGGNPAFATWRHYFRADLAMPVPEPVAMNEEVTPAAAALVGALHGDPVPALADLHVRECRSPAELVRLWRDDDMALGEDEPPSERYAAAAKDVERFVQRLGRSTGTAAPRLAQLPVGSFLMALHRCVDQAPDGTTTVRLDGDAMLDIVGSGYLDLPSDTPRVRVATLRRALPYFSGCRTGQAWVERAELLRRTVEERVRPLGEREDSHDDLERIRVAVGNPTRLVPWADLTLAEVATVEAAVRRVVQLVQEISERERVVLDDHLARLRNQLERTLRGLPESERDAIEAKLSGLGLGRDEEIDVGGLVDVVAMILGRTADFDLEGDAEKPDATEVKQLRGLDALGLSRLDRDLHLANLADDAFPTAGAAVGWPFDLEGLRASGDEAVEPVTVELFSTRAATAALGDLYLFWLALDGVEEGRRITLSWVSDRAGERRRLSPIVTLLTVPDVRSQHVQEVAGGVPIAPVRDPSDLPAELDAPNPSIGSVDDGDLIAVLDELDPKAAASALACPRRFAIQWAMGPTAAFGPDYLQIMLYGNVTNALVREGQENLLGARATTNDVWAHLTEGQRASSLDKSVVKPSGPSANAAWVLTLDGNAQEADPLDLAYQAAKDRDPAAEDAVVPRGPIFLPAGVDDPEVCAKCPVQSRCQQWRERDR
jgi:hypothetical protein